MEAVTTTLTEEQFNALPEIEFKPSRAVATVDDADENPRDSAKNIPTADDGVDGVGQEIGASQAEGSVYLEEEDLEQPPRNNVALDHAIDIEDENAGPAGENSFDAIEGVGVGSNCTMCSICIDDFEAGEKLTLLPRCQHAFHRDCIHPWLTERQGNCPLCKTYVLEANEENAQTAEHDDGPERDTSVSEESERDVDVETGTENEMQRIEATYGRPSLPREGAPGPETSL